MGVGYRVRGRVDDAALSVLHDAAFGEPGPVQPWDHRLHEHSLTWVTASAAESLVGFVNLAWDGGTHAFLLDTCVAPERQGEGVGAELVRRAADAAGAAGCGWLHVDFEPHLARFYARCGFEDTQAGLMRLGTSG